MARCEQNGSSHAADRGVARRELERRVTRRRRETPGVIDRVAISLRECEQNVEPSSIDGALRLVASWALRAEQSSVPSAKVAIGGADIHLDAIAE